MTALFFDDVSSFLETVRKQRFEEMEKEVRRQKIQLVWNFIGEVNLPNDDQTVERERKSKTA